ncbi:origin recognition complex subunit 1-like [Planococcus citri]|uniref:origin recognition complex subunit 1-like n=1 Tax=Planococcus citri TaxID=170843 RepID=UPI0031F778AF
MYTPPALNTRSRVSKSLHTLDIGRIDRDSKLDIDIIDQDSNRGKASKMSSNQDSQNSEHSFFSDNHQLQDMDCAIGVEINHTPHDEGVGTQENLRPFDLDFRDTTKDEIYAIFRKNLKWNESLKSEVKANFEFNKREISSVKNLIKETKKATIHLTDRISDVATQTERNILQSTAWYDELSGQLRETNISIEHTQSEVANNSSNIQQISEAITQINHETQVRDEGSNRMVEEINHIKESMRRNPTSSAAKTKTMAIDSGSVINAGIYFSDDKLFFPHEFLKHFDDYFSEANVAEKHKVIAFKGVITTSDRDDFLETVNDVSRYDEMKQKFLEFYWDRHAQNEAMKYCKLNFTTSNNIKSMANNMIRWARSLSHHRHGYEDDIIEMLIGKAPEQFESKLSEEGQTIDKFIKKLTNLAKVQRDPDNEVPITIRNNNMQRRRYNENNTIPTPRQSNSYQPSHEQLLDFWNQMTQKPKQPVKKNFNVAERLGFLPKESLAPNNNNNNNNNNKNTTTDSAKDRLDRSDQPKTTQPPSFPKSNQNSPPPNTKPFSIDKNGNLITNPNKFYNRTKTSPNIPPAPVQTVRFDETLDKYVLEETSQEDLSAQVNLCNLLNNIFSSDEPADSDQQTLTGNVQLMTSQISDANTEDLAPGNEIH